MSLWPDISAMTPDECRDYFSPLFEPKSVAVVGASATGNNRGNGFIREILAFGFKGDIYPIHPEADVVEGFKAYKSLAETPSPNDYVLISVPAVRVANILRTANGNARFAHVLSAGFGETSDGEELQAELIAAARDGGVRILGPNCNGAYSPRGGLTLTAGATPEPGPVGIISQSGGLGIDIIRRGQERGVRYRGVMTLGNCADIGPCDLLAFYLADPETKVIGLYLEGIDDGRRLFEILRESKAVKPVVIMKGGRTELGQAAALSHTGALAGSGHAWQALCRQTGAVLVENLEAFIDTLITFQISGGHAVDFSGNVALCGNGGGTGVLAVDAYADCGIAIRPFSAETQSKLSAMEIPPGTSIANPIDAPIGTLVARNGGLVSDIMRTAVEQEEISVFVLHFNLPVILNHMVAADRGLIENMIDAMKKLHDSSSARFHVQIVLRSDGSGPIDDEKRRLRNIALSNGFPVFDELTNAATGLQGLKSVSSFKASYLKLNT